LAAAKPEWFSASALASAKRVPPKDSRKFVKDLKLAVLAGKFD
jgi:hypothetical protein